MKETCNRILLSGYNALVFHTFAHQPDERCPGWQMEPFGSAINRKLTWWPLSKPFFTYLTRIQYMLQKGRPDARILALYADAIPAGKVRQEFPDAVIADIITGESVRDWLRVEQGRLVSPGRMRYDLLAVSPDIFLRPETLRALKKLVEEGACISGYYLRRYATNAGGAEARAEWEQLNDELLRLDPKIGPQDRQGVRFRQPLGTRGRRSAENSPGLHTRHRPKYPMDQANTCRRRCLVLADQRHGQRPDIHGVIRRAAERALVLECRNRHRHPRPPSTDRRANAPSYP